MPVVVVTDCDRCKAAVTPNVIGASASVGIEHGKSTSEMVQIYVDRLHHREHEEHHA